MEIKLYFGKEYNMYIKEIKISNFRNFRDASVPFHEGVNVIIGHNNTGKSNLLRAIGLAIVTVVGWVHVTYFMRQMWLRFNSSLHGLK